VQPDVTFVEGGQKFAPHREPQHDDGNRGAEACDVDDIRTSQRAGQRPLIIALDPRERAIVEDAARPAISRIGEPRHHQQREGERPELREAHRIHHRIEQLGFNAMEGEQRQIRRDDDRGRKEDRPRHLPGGVSDVRLGERLVRLGLAPAQNRLGHHDGAIDDDAKIDGAER